MSISLNVCDVIAHVKNIVDSIRCTVCDRAVGGRIRYLCGHTSCDECLIGTEGCMLCLTPPTSLGKPKSDATLSQRVQNAYDLLNACQDTFNLDVYRRLRVSEQLRAEKELFPECIQAPAKYSNKRKSTTTVGDKENLHISFQAGEHISYIDSFKMKKCNNYVQQWLENSKSYPRKALADLNVNKQNSTSKNTIFPKKTVKIHQNQSNTSYINRDTFNPPRKRSHSSTSFSLIDKENSVSELVINKCKRSKFESHLQEEFDNKVFDHTDNEESGIVIDDEPILIEDSQSQVIDKDKLALIAVQGADKERSDFMSFALESTQSNESLPLVYTQNKPPNEKKNNVPFYKKSSLADCCFYCKVDKPNSLSNKDNKNVSITIENQHFVTTINISKLGKVISDTKSVLVQTNLNDAVKTPEVKDISVTFDEKNNEMMLVDTRKNITDSLGLLKSHDINNLHGVNNESKKRGIVIDDSDSDESSLGGSFFQVTAEVHRSCEPIDYGILSEISTSELPSRSRNKVRCITPDSNNSSDKENCDPNKGKKQKNGKKSKYLKK